MLHQGDLAVVVARVHPADLRHRDVRLVDEEQIVLGKEAEERVGRASRRAAAQRPAVVLDARTVADLLHHSRSKRVRALRRWASNNLPARLSSSNRSSSSRRISTMAAPMRSSGNTKCLEG